MSQASFACLCVVGSLVIAPRDARAQSIGAGLATLLTEQTPPPPGYVRDRAAAEATFSTVASLFQVELANLPLTSPSGGFVYRFSPTFGTVERASDSFGPFYTERTLRSGRRQLSLGLTYEFATFSTLQGADLEPGTFPTNTARFAGQLQPFSIDTLSLTLDADTVSTFASYGVNDRLDVAVAIPITRVRFFGRRENSFLGQTTLQSARNGSATGVGDTTVNARYLLTTSSRAAVALGSDLRLPTGREEDLLGTGKTAWRLLGIASWQRPRLELTANGGFGVGGVSREGFWSGAASYTPGLRVTVVGELMGRYLANLHRVSDVYEPHPVLAGVETMRWLPEDGGTHIASMATGVKWNPEGNWIVSAHLLTRLTETGLRARFTPGIAVDYAVAIR